MAPAAWASWLNVLLGLWEAASPWVLGYAGVATVATENAVTVGLLIAFSGVWAALTWYVWPNWANLLLGVWLIISPSVLGYSGDVGTLAYANEIVVGVLVVLFAVISGLSKPQVLISD